MDSLGTRVAVSFLSCDNGQASNEEKSSAGWSACLHAAEDRSRGSSVGIWNGILSWPYFISYTHTVLVVVALVNMEAQLG